MSKYYDSFMLNDKGYGPLKFIKKGYDTEDKAAALMGRAVALYDFAMDFQTDLGELAEPNIRVTRFVDICIWIDDASKRVRNAWTNICYDYPGKGKADMGDPNITVEQIEYWYWWEYSALDCSKRMSETLALLFGWNRALTSESLLIPFKVLDRINGWALCPSDELQILFNYAEEHLESMTDWQMMKDIYKKDNYNEEVILPFRQMFVDKWKMGEDRLISVPATKRKEVNLNGG